MVSQLLSELRRSFPGVLLEKEVDLLARRIRAFPILQKPCHVHYRIASKAF